MGHDAARAVRLLPEGGDARPLACMLAGTARHLGGDLPRARAQLDDGARSSAVAAPHVQALCLAQLHWSRWTTVTGKRPRRMPRERFRGWRAVVSRTIRSPRSCTPSPPSRARTAARWTRPTGTCVARSGSRTGSSTSFPGTRPRRASRLRARHSAWVKWQAPDPYSSRPVAPFARCLSRRRSSPGSPMRTRNSSGPPARPVTA